LQFLHIFPDGCDPTPTKSKWPEAARWSYPQRTQFAIWILHYYYFSLFACCFSGIDFFLLLVFRIFQFRRIDYLKREAQVWKIMPRVHPLDQHVPLKTLNWILLKKWSVRVKVFLEVGLPPSVCAIFNKPKNPYFSLKNKMKPENSLNEYKIYIDF